MMSHPRLIAGTLRGECEKPGAPSSMIRLDEKGADNLLRVRDEGANLSCVNLSCVRDF